MTGQTAQACGFHHEAFFYAGNDEFLEGAVPYVEAGITAGETVLVVLPEPRLQLVKRGLGTAAEGVEFWSMEEMGRNPGRLISSWRDFLRDHDPDTGVRGLGEPAWPGRSAVEMEECELHERLLNLAFGKERALSVMCPYDASALEDSVLTGAERSHPVCGGLHGTSPSPRFTLDAPLEGSLPPRGRPAVTLAFSKADLGMVRHVVAQCARSAGLDPRRNEDLVLAVCEAATNSIQHGGGEGDLHVWDEGGALVCAISDAGQIKDPLVGRERPLPERSRGRGLWIANQLCDLVQIRSGELGTEVRMRMEFDG